MAFPASVIPSGNSYSLNVAGPVPGTSNPAEETLTLTAAAAAALLAPHQVDVRQHVAGDSPEASARRRFLTAAGAKASAFSPAPTPSEPGEGFWKTTLAVVQALKSGAGAEGAREDFWWPPRADKKVEWDCLLVALREEEGLGGADVGTSALGALSAEQLAHPDLWIASAPDGAPDAAEWVRRGAGAAVVFSPSRLTWASRNATFGRSSGSRSLTDPGAGAEASPASGKFAFACGAGGILAGLFEDLLGDNLFDKSWLRVDRADLEARPLRLSRACATGAAAARASREDGPERLLLKQGDLAGRVRAHAQAARREEYPEGEPRPWGSKGRK